MTDNEGADSNHKQNYPDLQKSALQKRARKSQKTSAEAGQGSKNLKIGKPLENLSDAQKRLGRSRGEERWGKPRPAKGENSD